ncbi:MAG: protein kinase domain-containing protein [Gemmatimonadaceae bacterium]
MRELTDVLQEILGYDYRLERELPGGGMSRLFLATERSLDRRVVVKVLPPELVCEAMVARFKREVEVTAQLSHPHILPVLRSGASHELLYYVMPYVEGESLRHRLTREGRLPVEDALLLLAEAADALAYAHARGVVHRDIKPENILLSDGHAVLADFGIARALRDDEALQVITTPGLPLGTFGYAPPEQVRGDRPADARADVYALAVVGYEMLTGEMPPADPAAAPPRRRTLLPAFARRASLRVTAARRETPVQASRAIMRGLSTAPEDRFQSATEFRDALREPYSRQVERRRRRRHHAIVGALSGAVVLAVVLLLWDPRINADLVAVSPFDAADPALRTWREGMADVLSRNFDGAGPLRAVPTRAVLRRWDGSGDDSSAVRIGRELGAGLVISGALRRVGGDSVRVEAAFIERTRFGTRTLDRVELLGLESRIAPMADSVTVRFLDALGRRRTLRAGGRPPLLGAHSILALKEFLHGEQLLRQNKYDSARVAYEAALRSDARFALAHWRMRAALRVVNGEWDRSSFDYALVASGLNFGLGQRDSLLILADSLYAAAPGFSGLETRLPYQRRRLEVLERAAQLYPDDPEVLTELGEARLHYGDLLGRTWEDARDAFERAIRDDSAYAPAYLHLVQLRGALYGADSARTTVAASLRYVPDDRRMRLVARLLEAAPVDSATIRDAGLETRELRDVAMLLTRWPSPDGRTLAVSRFLAAQDAAVMRRPHVRRLALHGRLAELARIGRASDWRENQMTAVFLAHFGALPAPVVDSAAAAWLRDGSPASLHAALLVAAQRRDTAALRAVVERSAAMVRGADTPETRYLRLAADAYAALARGDSAAALARLGQLPETPCTWSCVYEQIDRARLLEARGEVAEAARTFVAHPPSWDAIRAEEVLWMREWARLAERTGQPEAALRAYDYVARAWEGADPALADIARSARDAAARLRRPR